MGMIFMKLKKPFNLLSAFFFVIGILNGWAIPELNARTVSSNLDAIRVADYTNFTQITLEISNKHFTGEVSSLTKNPPVLMIRLKGVQSDNFGKEYAPETEAFEKISFSTDSNKNLVLTIPLAENVDIEGIFHHNWSEFMTIDLPLKTLNHKYVPPLETIKRLKQEEGKKVVIIDAGHGGLDPGTRGGYYIPVQERMNEKDVALEVAQRLKILLEKDSKYLPLLTRYGDYLPVGFGAKGSNRSDYIESSLYHRVEMAKQYCGDIFISIHLNAIGGRYKQRTVRGFEIFYLGDNYAEKMVADEKNLDIEARESLVNSRPKDSFIISALVKDKILYDSKQLASAIVEEIQTVPGVVLGPRPIRPNRFIVNKQFIMPSVLVELAYLSNKYDHANVKKASTRQAMAASLYRAVETFFYKPDDIPLVAVSTKPNTTQKSVSTSSQRSHKPSTSIPAYHVVRSGDTLSRIAERYGISVRQLRDLNRGTIKRGNRIFPKQKLRLPSSTRTTSSGREIKYKVKRQDTLEKIAIQFGTTVSELKSLNNKRNHLIYPGEELKVIARKQVASAHPINYKVRRGDTLGKIASRFKLSLSQLKRANGLRSNLIQVGQVLMIP